MKNKVSYSKIDILNKKYGFPIVKPISLNTKYGLPLVKPMFLVKKYVFLLEEVARRCEPLVSLLLGPVDFYGCAGSSPEHYGGFPAVGPIEVL